MALGFSGHQSWILNRPFSKPLPCSRNTSSGKMSGVIPERVKVLGSELNPYPTLPYPPAGAPLCIGGTWNWFIETQLSVPWRSRRFTSMIFTPQKQDASCTNKNGRFYPLLSKHCHIYSLTQARSRVTAAMRAHRTQKRATVIRVSAYVLLATLGGGVSIARTATSPIVPPAAFPVAVTPKAHSAHNVTGTTLSFSVQNCCGRRTRNLWEQQDYIYLYFHK